MLEIGMETRAERRLRKLRTLASDTPGGIRALADVAGLNWQTLDQILKGVQLPSGNPRSLGDRAARSIEDAMRLGRGWFDAGDEQSELGHSKGFPPHISEGPVVYPAGRGETTIPALQPRADDIQVPLTNAAASMGRGLYAPEHDEVVSSMTVSRSWLSRNATYSSVENLALLTGYGDSMTGTFEHGDLLLVDRGIREVKLDAVYVLALNDELYIKRLQRRPSGEIRMISDNPKYEPYTITEAEREKFEVLGRVVMIWNAKRL